MGLGLCNNGCAVKIHDFQSCGLIPIAGGASCDDFLSSNPETLNQAQWEALEATWNAAGSAVECMESASLVQLKAELESLCTPGKCTDEQVAALNRFFLKIEMDEDMVRNRSK